MTGIFCREAWSGAGMDALIQKTSQAYSCQLNPSVKQDEWTFRYLLVLMHIVGKKSLVTLWRSGSSSNNLKWVHFSVWGLQMAVLIWLGKASFQKWASCSDKFSCQSQNIWYLHELWQWLQPKNIPFFSMASSTCLDMYLFGAAGTLLVPVRVNVTDQKI